VLNDLIYFKFIYSIILFYKALCFDMKNKKALDFYRRGGYNSNENDGGDLNG